MSALEKRYWEEIINLNKLQLKLLAATAVRDMPFPKKVQWLSSLGVSPREIAKILGTTSNTIRVAKSQLKKSKGFKITKTKLSTEEVT
ncbi:MAG: hypothetical protein HYW50_00865 [Candidatus Diapherotrites archaeon]|nr:hypothetical protein [Candidatus Diapherotrites archaeon]